ncbi:hypothetical protein GCM10018966_075790 [Streptomyces yanii]
MSPARADPHRRFVVCGEEELSYKHHRRMVSCPDTCLLVQPIMWLLRAQVVDVGMGRGDLTDTETA